MAWSRNSCTPSDVFCTCFFTFKVGFELKPPCVHSCVEMLLLARIVNIAYIAVLFLIFRFTAPLVDFLKHGPPAYVEDENEDLSKGQNALDSCEHHFFMAPSERALYCKKCAVVKKTGLSDRALTAVADVTTRKCCVFARVCHVVFAQVHS